MKIPALCAMTLAFSLSAFSQSSIPPAPTLTVGAAFKGLRFDWDTVAGATSYQLEYRANQTGPFVKMHDFPATATSTGFSFPLHLYNWTYARYRLAACNSAGCSRSTAVPVSSHRRDAVGYFKAAQPVAGALFGDRIDLSPGGYNMVVAAPGEYTSRDYVKRGGAVYVFRRGNDRKWRQRARLEPQVAAYAENEIFLSTAISTSGDTVAVGMPTHAIPGVDEGHVDVFQFTNNAWSRTRLPRPAGVDSFGSAVALNEAGNILAASTHDGTISGVVIYRLLDGAWQNVRTLSETGQGSIERCDLPALSRDGSAVAVRCEDLGSATRPRRDYIRIHSGANWSVRTEITLGYPASNNLSSPAAGIGIDRSGDTIAVQVYRAGMGIPNGVVSVQVYKRNSGVYSQVATLTPGSWRSDENKFQYGRAVSVSGDGQTIAVGDAADNGKGLGTRPAPLDSGTAQTGAVYVYRLSDTWKLAHVVKPNYNPNPGQAHIFPEHVDLSRDGKTLIVAAPRESSSASGIDGDWANTGLGTSGAIFMY